MKSFVVGGAGFIGSHLVERLGARGPVTIFDDLSVGKRAFVAGALDSGAARLVEGTALDLDHLAREMRGHDVVFHLAANPEARWGLERTRLDLEVGTIAAYNTLEAMRLTNTPRLVFSSSGTVYGETDVVAAEGDLLAPPISLYGASKVAGEALISAFVSCFDLRARIFRFGNVVGPRGTHGAALDFLKKLAANGGAELEVLGDGEQAKPYLWGWPWRGRHALRPRSRGRAARGVEPRSARHDQGRPHRRAVRRRVALPARSHSLHGRRARLARRRAALAHEPGQARRAGGFASPTRATTPCSAPSAPSPLRSSPKREPHFDHDVRSNLALRMKVLYVLPARSELRARSTTHPLEESQ